MNDAVDEILDHIHHDTIHCYRLFNIKVQLKYEIKDLNFKEINLIIKETPNSLLNIHNN